MRLEGGGFRAELPEHWEGAVSVPSAGRTTRARARDQGVALTEPPALHLASLALPAVRGDFGSGVVELMDEGDAFVAVVEYGPENLGTALFDTGPLPRRLTRRSFAPSALQRPLPGQAGFQAFCTEAGRPLCLYAVLAGPRGVDAALAQVNQVLAGLTVMPR